MENESKLNLPASFTVRTGRDEIKSCFGIASGRLNRAYVYSRCKTYVCHS